MASETTQLNSLSIASAFQQRAQGGHHWSSITGHAEIGPVEVIVGPRRIPLGIQIQTEIRSLVAGVGIPDVKRNGRDLGPIRQHDEVAVQVHVKPLMIMVSGSALCRFIVRVPVDLALHAHHDRSDVSHAFIVASAGSPDSPQPLRCPSRQLLGSRLILVLRSTKSLPRSLLGDTKCVPDSSPRVTISADDAHLASKIELSEG